MKATFVLLPLLTSSSSFYAVCCLPKWLINLLSLVLLGQPAREFSSIQLWPQQCSIGHLLLKAVGVSRKSLTLLWSSHPIFFVAVANTFSLLQSVRHSVQNAWHTHFTIRWSMFYSAFIFWSQLKGCSTKTPGCFFFLLMHSKQKSVKKV